jgi:hypothetical protein
VDAQQEGVLMYLARREADKLTRIYRLDGYWLDRQYTWFFNPPQREDGSRICSPGFCAVAPTAERARELLVRAEAEYLDEVIQ